MEESILHVKGVVVIWKGTFHICNFLDLFVCTTFILKSWKGRVWFGFSKEEMGLIRLRNMKSRYFGCSPCVKLIGLRACVWISVPGLFREPHSWIRPGHPAWQGHKAPVRNKAGPSLWHRCCNAVETAAHHCTQHQPKRSLRRITLRLQTQETRSSPEQQTPTLPTGHFPPAASDSRTLRAKFPSNHISSWGVHLRVCISVYLPSCQICFPALTYPLVWFSLSIFLSYYFIFIFISGPKSFWKHQEMNK